MPRPDGTKGRRESPPRGEIPIPVPDGCPAHLRDRMDRLVMLQARANGLRGLLGVPVWLVGSALRDDNPDPRDWDVRLLLPEHAFEARYGPVDEWILEGATGLWGRTRWRWSDECTRFSREWAGRARLNVDLQIYPLIHWQGFRGKPRMRLDTRWAMRPDAAQHAPTTSSSHPAGSGTAEGGSSTSQSPKSGGSGDAGPNETSEPPAAGENATSTGSPGIEASRNP